MRGFFKWLGAEANSRAVASLLAVGSALGVMLVFLWTNVVVLLFPEAGMSTYADGYRAAKRITELELQVQALEQRLQAMWEARKIEEETENMTDEEIAKELAGDARN